MGVDPCSVFVQVLAPFASTSILTVRIVFTQRIEITPHVLCGTSTPKNVFYSRDLAGRMITSSVDSPLDDRSGRDNRATLLKTLWPWLIEVWISGVLVTFFVVRILGSNTSQRVLDALRHFRN
jgi:hypothetical protein